MGRVRVIVPNGPAHPRHVTSHVRSLQEAGAKVILVSADRPYAAMVETLRQAGVDVELMHFVDTVTTMNGALLSNRPRNATFLSSPGLLEALAMRIEQAALRQGAGAHVVLESLDPLILHNGRGPVHEFSHYLAGRLRAQGVPGDFFVGAKSLESWGHLLGTFTDETLVIDPATSDGLAAGGKP